MKTMPKTTSEEKYRWIKPIFNKKIINHQIILQRFFIKKEKGPMVSTIKPLKIV